MKTCIKQSSEHQSGFLVETNFPILSYKIVFIHSLHSPASPFSSKPLIDPMGLTISLKKPPPQLLALILTDAKPFCQGTVESDESFIVLIPLPGKLIEIMRVLKKYDVLYELQTDSKTG